MSRIQPSSRLYSDNYIIFNINIKFNYKYTYNIIVAPLILFSSFRYYILASRRAPNFYRN